MNRSPFFTIIIPIYNKFSYILSSINSLLAQSFKDFEIILIDDGSTDGSLELCKKIAEIESFITILQQTNKGAGIARNLGIKYARGSYICFFDIDDKVYSDWLENIYELIIDKLPEVLIYSYREINQKLKIENSFKFKDRYYEDNDSIKKDYFLNLSGVNFNNGFVWNKVYKREFLIYNHIIFPSLRIQQDEVFNHEIYKRVRSLMLSSKVLYHYYVHYEGNTRNTYIPNRLKIFEDVKYSFFSLSQFWQLENKDLIYYIHLRFIRNSLYNRNPDSQETKESYIKKLFKSESLHESVIYILTNSKQLCFIEKLYLKGIIKKSKPLFSLAEMASMVLSIEKEVYRRLFR